MELSAWFLVLSNLAYFLPVAVLSYKSMHNKIHYVPECTLFIAVFILSSCHHLCDSDSIGKCMQSKAILYGYDLLFSHIAIAGAFMAFYRHDAWKFYFMFTILGPILTIVFFWDNYIGSIVLVSFAAFFFLINQVREALSTRKQWIFYLVSTCLIGGAIYVKLLGDRREKGIQNYILWHSLWHSKLQQSIIAVSNEQKQTVMSFV